MRTTSSVESMNSALNRGCKARPNIFKFIDRIRLHEFSKQLDLIDLFEDDVTEEFERKRKLDRERELKITHFTNLLLQNDITVQEFLEAMSTKSFLPGTGTLGMLCIECIWIHVRRIWKLIPNFQMYSFFI